MLILCELTRVPFCVAALPVYFGGPSPSTWFHHSDVILQSFVDGQILASLNLRSREDVPRFRIVLSSQADLFSLQTAASIWVSLHQASMWIVIRLSFCSFWIPLLFPHWTWQTFEKDLERFSSFSSFQEVTLIFVQVVCLFLLVQRHGSNPQRVCSHGLIGHLKLISQKYEVYQSNDWYSFSCQ